MNIFRTYRFVEICKHKKQCEIKVPSRTVVVTHLFVKKQLINKS